MIEAVLFDYGGVLTKAGQARSVERLLGNYWSIDPDSIDITDLEANFQRGKITSEQFFKGLVDLYPDRLPIDEQTFLDIDIGFYDPNPKVYEIAQKLRDHNISTGIITNVFPIFAEKIRELGGYDDFHPVVLSYEVGAVKPDKKIYRAAAKQLKMKPDKIVFIDDQPINLEPARKMGMFTVHASSTSEDQLIKAIPAILQDKNGIEIQLD